MIDIALQKLIAQVAGIGNRVTPSSEAAPVTKDLPRVVYTLIDDPNTYTDDGVCALRKATYQLDTFAARYSDARAVLLRITTPANAPTSPGLDGYRGTIANTLIHRISFGSQRGGVAASIPGENQVIARSTVDVVIDYRELLQQPNFATEETP